MQGGIFSAYHTVCLFKSPVRTVSLLIFVSGILDLPPRSHLLFPGECPLFSPVMELVASLALEPSTPPPAGAESPGAEPGPPALSAAHHSGRSGSEPLPWRSEASAHS